ncbi:MAG: hypothetical protein J5865_00160 [Lachnospiraceae bacterium]|nr:hypothetical protein [Lachnospiraceae bacterium]
MKTTFKYDHYYKYAELESNLKKLQKKYPDLVTVEANCVTPEGRKQYVVTLTNKKTGDALSKPGWYLDGNIHAGEVTASMAAMHTIDYVVTNYGEDQTCTTLLDDMTIYVIPRVTPDGAETYLSTPYSLRSANRPYKTKEGGIKQEDIDGDGVIRMMRIPTKYGAWKIDPKDAGTMTLRDPGDRIGTFYDVYPEGYLEDFDGSENMKLKKAEWGLDFNRNFPFGWYPDPRTPGAGQYPLCNPETKALADFAIAHPNICGAAIGHTFGGLIMYVPGTRKSKTAPASDIQALKTIAQMCVEEMDYIPMNLFDTFISDQDQYDSGAFDDWMYETQGIPAYTIEFWNMAKKAGCPLDWEKHREEEPWEEIKRFNACMKWVKENVPQYYKDWEPYDHPTFGKVEIGGFNYKFTYQNPPEHMLLQECENDTRFNIRFALSAPKLVIESLEAEQLKAGLYKVTAVVGNIGYLPTNVTEQANILKVSKPVEVSIEGGELFSGKACEKIGDLEGYSGTQTGIHFYGNISTTKSAKAKKKVSWVVSAKKGTVITVCAKNPKAGTASAGIKL